MTYHTRGIVLSRRNFREHDRLFTIYTHKVGKLEVLGRGTRKIQSKLASHTEPFTLTNLLLAQGKRASFSKGWEILVESQLIKKFVHLRSSLEEIAAVSRMVEAVSLLTKPGLKDERIFRLLKDFLCHCCCEGRIASEATSREDSERSRGGRPANITRDGFVVASLGGRREMVSLFIWQLLSLLGYRPELGRCVRCHLVEYHRFSSRYGGLLCFRCGFKDPKALPVSQLSLNFLEAILSDPLFSLSKRQLSSAIIHQSQNIINDYYHYILGEGELPSERFMRAIDFNLSKEFSPKK